MAKKGKGNRIFVEGGKVRVPIETEFKNNIFYFEDKAEWGFEPDATCMFENNLFYNVSPRGENLLTVNPMFVNPGSGGTNIDMLDLQRLSGYWLKENSLCMEAGAIINKNGGKDLCGNPLYKGLPDIGAFEQ